MIVVPSGDIKGEKKTLIALSDREVNILRGALHAQIEVAYQNLSAKEYKECEELYNEFTYL